MKWKNKKIIKLYKKLFLIVLIILLILIVNLILTIKYKNEALEFVHNHNNWKEKSMYFLSLDDKRKSYILKELFRTQKKYLEDDGVIHTKIIIDKKNDKVKKFIRNLVKVGDYEDVKYYIQPDFIQIKYDTEEDIRANEIYLKWAKENNYAGLTGDKIKKLKKYELETKYKLWKSDKSAVKKELKKIGLGGSDPVLTQWHSYITTNGYPLEYKQIMSWLDENEKNDIITSEDKKWVNSRIGKLREKIGSVNVMKKGLSKLYKFVDKVKMSDIKKKTITLIEREDISGAKEYFNKQDKKYKLKLRDEILLIIKKYEK